MYSGGSRSCQSLLPLAAARKELMRAGSVGGLQAAPQTVHIGHVYMGAAQQAWWSTGSHYQLQSPATTQHTAVAALLQTNALQPQWLQNANDHPEGALTLTPYL
jgi:hypothetical protein